MLYLNILFLLIIGIGKSPAVGESVKLLFFYGNTVDRNNDLSDAAKILKHSKFKKGHETVLYIHGYVESPASATVQLIANAYISRPPYNILVLDWSSLVNGSYETAVANAYEVGPKIAAVLIDLFKKGLNRFLFHVVGHSLGGQLAGIIGKSTIQLSNNRIKLFSISALDPAGPGFYPNGTLPINVNDAELVQVIHTDAEKYGSPVNTSCVDFMVNTGKRFQLGCPKGVFPVLSANDTCSHQRSVHLWAESVANRRPTFLATNANFTFIKIHMGIDCPLYALPGIYKLSTNSEPPYSL